MVLYYYGSSNYYRLCGGSTVQVARPRVSPLSKTYGGAYGERAGLVEIVLCGVLTLSWPI